MVPCFDCGPSCGEKVSCIHDVGPVLTVVQDCPLLQRTRLNRVDWLPRAALASERRAGVLADPFIQHGLPGNATILLRPSRLKGQAWPKSIFQTVKLARVTGSTP